MVDYYNYKMSGSEEELESHTQPGMTKAELRRVKISLDFFFLRPWNCGGQQSAEIQSIVSLQNFSSLSFFWMDMFSTKNSRIIARSFFDIFFFLYLSKNRYILPICLKQIIQRDKLCLFLQCQTINQLCKSTIVKSWKHPFIKLSLILNFHSLSFASMKLSNSHKSHSEKRYTIEI